MANVLAHTPACSVGVSRKAVYRQQTGLAKLAFAFVRPERRRIAVGPSCYSGLAANDLGSGGGLGLLSQIATLVGVTAAAWWSARILDQGSSEREERTECATCNGTGYVDCVCLRWSDKDTGCATCQGRGKMVCNSCGGGGTAVPVVAKIMARREGKYVGR